MEKIRTLVVDDSFFMRKVISDILASDPQIEIIGDASNGEDALEKIQQLRPQVVTMDYEMPKMNGLEALKKIMQLERHPAVLVVSGYVQEGSDITLQFLQEGAVDFIPKPSGTLSLDMNTIKEQLIEKVKVAAKVDTSHIRRFIDRQKKDTQSLAFHKNQGVVVIGASTGGPAALDVLLPQFPAHFPLPVLVAQHLPKEFTASFVERLAKNCQLHVVLGVDEMKIEPGVIYIVPGGADSQVVVGPQNKPQLQITINTVDIETPSVNKLMKSAADVYKEHTIGIILTGMGKDGTLGMEEIKEMQGKTLVQDESTSVVYGMGREVVERGLADDILPLDVIVEKISELLT